MGDQTSRPNLLVFSDDWGRHPSSCQHLVGQLLDRYQVYWVNTIGTRCPQLNLATFKRGCEKLSEWFRPRPGNRTGPDLPKASLPPNLRVLKPFMWPWFSRRFDRNLNRELLHRQLTPFVRSLSAPVVAVTTIPIVADLVGLLPVESWVYYCVDDFTEWPGLDKRALLEMDEDLIRAADRVIVVSETLRQRMAARGRTAPLLTHGVDLDFWQTDRPTTIAQLDGLERPLIVFWGVVDRRMDVAFLERLAADLSKGTILLVGPDNEPDPALSSIPRVVRVPPVPFSLLPSVGHEADVLIMPYDDLPVTRAMQPLKLKEYLATGKPVVVRDLPATRSWGDSVDLVTSPEDFSATVRLRVETGLPDSQRQARGRLTQESWEAKSRVIES